MRIDVTYANEPPRVIETSGESLLSPSTVAGSPEWRGGALPVTAVMLRPRTDLVGQDGQGLVVELCAWSADDGPNRARATLDDLGGRREVPRLLFHVFRVWEVLPAGEVERAVDIDIDGRIHLSRIGGRLLDLTAYERMEERLLSANERAERPLDQRVLLVHDRLRWTHPNMGDSELGDLYGLGGALFDYAIGLAGATDSDEAAGDDAQALDDGFDELAAALNAGGDRAELASVLADAMFDDPCLTIEAVGRALEARGMHVDDLAGLWDEAQDEVDEFTGF
ncbi:MAG: hypothetical protein IKG69_04455 [Atopobiaceae bacterium]|nr:hypothetical protein [Atopobiaceae bacterium]